jgi:hypothetical protein
MSVMSFIRHIRRYFDRRHVDWTLQRGDMVYSTSWPKPLRIVALNWALLAAAVELHDQPRCLVVWPIAGLSRYPPRGPREAT